MLALEVSAIPDDTMLKQFHMSSLETVARHDPKATPRDDRWKGYVSVIVPVYNEAAHLDELLRAIQASPVKKEIIIVDDGSTDGTREKLQALPPIDDVTIVFHEKNYGKGAAIRTALAHARGEYVLIQDSDLEYDPQDYPVLLRPLETGQANVVYGVRPDRPERGLRFFLGAKLLTHLTNLLYGAGIHDEATCYKVIRQSVLEQDAVDLPALRVLPGSDREAVPDGREDRGGPDFVPPALGGGRQKNPPFRWVAGDLDLDPLPLRPAFEMDAAGAR